MLEKKLNIKSQRGAAIIVALFVTALVAAAAIAMIERLRIDLRRTELILNDKKAHQYAEGSIAWAMEQLNSNIRQKKPDKLIDVFPMRSPVNTIENVTLVSDITDQESLFNINNLTNPDANPGFIQLVKAVDPTANIDDINNLVIAIRDWISPSGTNNQLDDYYAKQIPAYVAPHRLMASISELRLVKGITPKLFTQLSPFITALPEATSININTASAPVLMSLSPSLTRDAAQAIVNYRQQHPFLTQDSFLQFDVVKNHNINDKKITTSSSYFLVKTNVKVDNQELKLYTLLHRMLNNAKPMEIMVWQSKGTL